MDGGSFVVINFTLHTRTCSACFSEVPEIVGRA
jgi:hypothetical protein